jgi:hypothetical protein
MPALISRRTRFAAQSQNHLREQMDQALKRHGSRVCAAGASLTAGSSVTGLSSYAG